MTRRRRPVRRRRSRSALASAGGRELLRRATGLTGLLLMPTTVLMFAVGATLLGFIAAGSAALLMLVSVAARGPRTVATTKRIRTRKPAAYKTRAQRKRERRAAVLSGRVRSGTTRIAGPSRCGWRCQRSRLPTRTCRCPCGGKSHGTLRGSWHWAQY